MSDLSPKRYLAFAALLFIAASAFASTPSSRYQNRMAYDALSRRVILFGGLTAKDNGTALSYFLGDTWQWNGTKWNQLFPAHAPSARSAQVMVYDSTRGHIVLFSGHNDPGDLNDTWYFNGVDWIQISTPNSPPARFLSSGSYDKLRDRVVIFGGTRTSADQKTFTTVYDTWEFDGTTWRQIGGEGPHVAKPVLVYDEEQKKTYMLGIDDAGTTLMYEYNAEQGSWSKLTPSTLPACVNEGILLYNPNKNRTVYTNGICASTATENETMEWDGSNWTKVDVKLNAIRLFGSAAAYDIARDNIIIFGGTPPGLNPLNLTYVLDATEGWLSKTDLAGPGPRSLFSFTTDPVHNTIWMYGGVNEGDTLSDFWQFQNGVWQPVAAANGPTACQTPNAAFDTDRQKLVVVCATSEVFEWDGTAWTSFKNLKTSPVPRRFSSMVYDQTLKKTVLFGGFDDANYLDQTWTWDGTQWVRVKSNPASSRQLATMWYDPILKKTVVYGGLGRITSGDRLTRFDDMWTFDGRGWTQLKPTAGTPPARYGAQSTVDPRTGHLLLFGGLRLETRPPVPPSTLPQQVQVYANDFWEWDGSVWKQLTTTNVPPARENGAMAYDPTLGTFVLYGGWAGHYLSDMWTLTGTTWSVRPDASAPGRRRSIGPR